jgi:hypothetical protein
MHTLRLWSSTLLSQSRWSPSQHQQCPRRSVTASASADHSWLGSRFAAGAQQQLQEIAMRELKERLSSDTDARVEGAPTTPQSVCEH